MFKFFRNLFLLFLFSISSAFAVGDAFDQARFDQLLKEGKPVLVAIHADWCSTCRAQDVFLKELLSAPPYNKFQVLRVDFDKQKKVVRSFKVQWQSTLIVFKNGKEIERSTSDTDKDSVALMLRKAL
ncbi:MAG: thioredoxin family protein [Nitrosomonadales bacterium]|nr:thioredoxin family protein [Nitrosomonadales bacterium]